jgi:hypothetical protein
MNYRSNRVRNRKTAGILYLLLLLLMIAGCYRKAGSDTDEDTDDTDTKTETDVNRDTKTDTPSDTGSVGTGTGSGTDSRTSTDYLDPCDMPGVICEPCDGPGVTCSECKICAENDPRDCGEAYWACLNTETCAAIETCHNEQCDLSELTDDDWLRCKTDCRNAADANGVALYEAFERCINCDFCRPSCGSQPGIYCDDVVCDGLPCYTECWGCAMNTACKDEVAACKANADCTGLDNCRNVNCVEPGLTGELWVACENSCNAEWADGVALLNAWHTCIYCVGCPTSCAMDADDRCE